MVIAEVKVQGLIDRLDRASHLVGAGKVHEVLEVINQYVVESDGGGFYVVMNGQCLCKDSQMRATTFHGLCNHVLAVDLYRESPTPEPEPDDTEETEEEREARINEQLADLYPCSISRSMSAICRQTLRGTR